MPPGRGNRSRIWDYFRKIGKFYATCSFCERTLTYKSTSNNLKKHLFVRHNIAREVLNMPSANTKRKREELSGEEVIREAGVQENTDTLEEENASKESDTDIWQHFIPLENNFAKCTLCMDSFSYTTHGVLRNHLAKRHHASGGQTMPEKVWISHAEKNLNNDEEFDGRQVTIDDSSLKKRHRKRYSKIWNHFTDLDGTYGSCNTCQKIFSFKSTTFNLKKHLSITHGLDDLNDVVQEPRDMEDDEDSSAERDEVASPQGSKSRRLYSLIWRYFERMSSATARCAVCLRVLSHRTTMSNLRKHLERKHPNLLAEEQLEADEVTSKMTLCPLTGEQVIELETKDDLLGNQDDNMDLEEVYLEDEDELEVLKPKSVDYRPSPSQKNSAHKPKRRKSHRVRHKSESSSSSDEEPEQQKKQKDKEVDSLEQFGKYITSLLRTLPMELAMKLQTDFVSQIMDARLTYQMSKRTAVVANEDHGPGRYTITIGETGKE